MTTPTPRPAFADRVVAAIRAVPTGTVATYGEIAAEVGLPRAARAVGRVLRTTQAAVPWWRIVTATGRLAPGHEEEQARRLVAEGIAVEGGHVRGLRPR